jgi:hypothetical protein
LGKLARLSVCKGLSLSKDGGILGAIAHVRRMRSFDDRCQCLILQSRSGKQTISSRPTPDLMIDLPRELYLQILTIRAVRIPDNQESLIATTLRIAAVRNMALEPQRKREIVERIEQITTEAQAVAFIKGVEAKLEGVEAPRLMSCAHPRERAGSGRPRSQLHSEPLGQMPASTPIPQIKDRAEVAFVASRPRTRM